MRISELGLSRRATNCLYRAGIYTVEELRQKHTWELQNIRSFGNKSMLEVHEALAQLEKPETNADRIRAMSDRELAYFLADKYVAESCHRLNDEGYEPTATQIEAIKHTLYCTWMNWLRQPAEEG